MPEQVLAQPLHWQTDRYNHLAFVLLYRSLLAVTVIGFAGAPTLHVNVVPAPDAVNSELPQLSITETEGADGTDFGAAVALADGPVQPFSVCVTV